MGKSLLNNDSPPTSKGRHKLISGVNDLLTVNSTLAAEWHPIKNGSLKPSDVLPWSSKKVWWLCEQGHEWDVSIGNRSKGNGCPYCSGHVPILGINDLATVNPALAAEWHPIKNESLKPSEVLPGSRKKVWWLCKQGHEWHASINGRSNGSGCPYCSGKYVLLGFNDLFTVNPTLATEWHPIKNGSLKPSEVLPGSKKKYGGFVNKDMSGMHQ